MTTTPEQMLDTAQNWTRQILQDSYQSAWARGAVPAWVDVLNATANAWEAIPATGAWMGTDIVTGTPLQRAITTARQINQATGQQADLPVDPRVARICELVDSAAAAIAEQLPRIDDPDEPQMRRAAILRAGLVNTAYMMTHATVAATSHRADFLRNVQPERSRTLAVIADRIQGVEQVLDAHFRRRPSITGPTPEVDAADLALATLQTVVHTTPPQPGNMNQLVIADLGFFITTNTAALAIQSADEGFLNKADIRSRLLPALEESAHQWESNRRTWLGFASRDTRPDPDLVSASNAFREAFQARGLWWHPGVNTAMTGALCLGTELAYLNRTHLNNPELRAPAAVVTLWADEAIRAIPNLAERNAHMKVFDTLQGPAPAALPEVVRRHLDAQAKATIEASQTARSAGNVLADRSGYYPILSLHQGQTTLTRRPTTPPPVSTQPGHGSPRIG